MDTMTVSQGFALQETITVRDYQDNPVVTYTGSESMSGSVRPGRTVLPSLTFTPTWGNPAAGTVNVSLTAAQTLTLDPGQYLIQVGLADKSADFYEGYLVVSYSAGTAVLPPTYGTYDDLLAYAPWIMKLQSETQVAGFAIERGLARGWLDNVIVQHSNWMFLTPQIGQSGFMPMAMFPAMINQPPNLWLRQQLNLDYLVRRQSVIEITAKKAVYFICRPQLDALNDRQERLAAWFGSDADRMASALRAEITLGVAHPNNTDAWPSVTVDCGRASLRG
jgi:hypothetical protein